MMMKKVVLLLCLGLIPLAAMAQEKTPAPKDQVPKTYVIKKGDTLWGISQRFLKDTGYWPNLWSHNQQITNPHFIYPGQELLIYDGRISLVPAEEQPAAAEAIVEAAPAETAAVVPIEPAPKPQEEIVIRAPGGASSFIATEELESAGVLVDADDSRILLATADKVFLDMKNLPATKVGDRFTLFIVRQDVTDPMTKEKAGVLVTDLGVAEIVEINPAVATARIIAADMEISRGALVRPWQPAVREVALKRAERVLAGTILTGGTGQIALGQYDIFYLNLGTDSGLLPGNLLYISRPRKATEFALRKEELPLPDALLGSAVVLDTRSKTATALILKMTNKAIYRGDQVITVTE